MTEFALVSNGFVASGIPDAELTGIFKNLKALKKDSYVDFTVVLKGHMAVEVIRCVRRLTGDSFRDWMKANSDGPIGPLVRDLLNYLNGKVGYHTVHSSIAIQESRLTQVDHFHSAVYTPTTRQESSLEPLLKQGMSLHDYDFYRLMAGIGAVDIARIFLLLGGESYYA